MKKLEQPKKPVITFPPGKSLALCVIAGNVEQYIERFLVSFGKLTPYIYLVRAIGNQVPDRTLEIARSMGVKTAIYENKADHADWDHVDDFGAARQKAFSMGETDGHAFLMWADTDDCIDDGSVAELRSAILGDDFDCLFMPYRLSNNNLAPVRERVIRSGTYRWQDAIHETLTATIPDPKLDILMTAAVTHMPGTHRHDRPNDRNIRILESLPELPRWCFYLCQEYEVKGRQAEAIQTALKGLKGWQSDRTTLQTCEAYELYLMLARWTQDPNGKLALLREAWALEPWRREALAMMTAAYCDLDLPRECLSAARMCVSLPEPNERAWTHRSALYRWSGVYLYTMALRMNGFQSEADTIEEDMFRKSGNLISLIHPTRGRPEQATRTRSLWLERARVPERVEHLFGIADNDKESLDVLGRFRHAVSHPKDAKLPTTVANANAAYAKSSGRVIVFVADDVEPPFWWDEMLLEQIGDPDQPTVLEVGDGIRGDGLLTHPVFTRPVPALLGLGKNEMFSPDYDHVFVDNEFTFRARKARLVRPSTLRWVHRHPVAGTADMDFVYELGNAPDAYVRGETVFRKRNPDAYGPAEVITDDQSVS